MASPAVPQTYPVNRIESHLRRDNGETSSSQNCQKEWIQCAQVRMAQLEGQMAEMQVFCTVDSGIVRAFFFNFLFLLSSMIWVCKYKDCPIHLPFLPLHSPPPTFPLILLQ